MQINEIQLTNIGPYRGINTFDFQPDSNKNVILVGGENGAGKTTLLNAIKLGLFGSYGFGYKSENADYYNKVQSILNNDAKKLNENNFRIQLNISLVDNFERINYTLYRYWKYNNDKLRETFEIVANGKHYSEYEIEVFSSKFKEIMPPQLLDLCLFDGEEIARIINEDRLGSYLKNLSRVVFNLDLFETLEYDLENYSSQHFNAENNESLENELFELNLQEKELKTNLTRLRDEISELIAKRKEHSDEYQRIKNNFEKYGGLIKEERDDILSQINAIDHTRKQNIEAVKDFVANTLPFFLAKDLLIETKKQIEEEEQLQLFKQMELKLTEENVTSLLQSIPGSHDSGASEVLKNELLKLMKPNDEIIQIHGASFSESSLVENMVLTVTGESDKIALKTMEQNKSLLLEQQELRHKLKNNDSTNEFSEMIQEMEEHQIHLNKIDGQLKNLELEKDELNNRLAQLNSNLEKVQIKLKDYAKTASSFLESQKIITLSRRFRELQSKKKLQLVQIEASKMLRKIFRKQDYISYIDINHDTYNVMLFDQNKDEIEKTTLSAGEKEILLLSLIWAIFKCSGRKVPFIFDTLLGRLDKTHKAAVLTEFIPYFGDQVIILSTDTEIDDKHYDILKDHVSKEYMLDFNVNRKHTRILNTYFAFNKMELKL